MWGWEEPQRDGCALDSTRTVCREHTRSGHTASRSTSTDCTTLRDLNTSSHVTHVAAAWGSGPGCRRRVWNRPAAPPAISRSGGVGCMRALAAARRGSRGGASTERGVETEQRPGEAGAGAEAAAPHPAHGLLPSPVSTVLPRRGTHTWPQGCWPSVHTATGRQVSSVGDKRFLGRAGGDGKAGRGRSGAGTGQQ